MRVEKSIDTMLEEIGYRPEDAGTSSYSMLELPEPLIGLLTAEQYLRQHHPALSHIANDLLGLLERAILREQENDYALPVSLKVLRGERGYVVRIRSPEPVYAGMARVPGFGGKDALVRNGLQFSVDDDGASLNVMKLYGRSGQGMYARAVAPDLGEEVGMRSAALAYRAAAD